MDLAPQTYESEAYGRTSQMVMHVNLYPHIGIQGGVICMDCFPHRCLHDRTHSITCERIPHVLHNKTSDT